MYATLTIAMDNAAFGNEPQSAPASQELSRILRALADSVDGNGSAEVHDEHWCFDANGNRVGELVIRDGEANTPNGVGELAIAAVKLHRRRLRDGGKRLGEALDRLGESLGV